MCADVLVYACQSQSTCCCTPMCLPPARYSVFPKKKTLLRGRRKKKGDGEKKCSKPIGAPIGAKKGLLKFSLAETGSGGAWGGQK